MKILFVCSGNTCRSCMAEAIFNHLNKSNDFVALSAGISAFPGSKTSLNSAIVLKENINIDISSREAIQLTPYLIDDASLVLTMTTRIRDILRDTNSTNSNKIYSLNEYIGIDKDISDPYGGNIDVYRKTYADLKSCIVILIEKLKEDKSIRWYIYLLFLKPLRKRFGQDSSILCFNKFTEYVYKLEW